MSQLGQHLLDHSEEIIDLWYGEWRASPHPHEDVAEDLLRDSLAMQLRLIGAQLVGPSPELPSEMWKISERLHPEDRVEQKIPIEDEVLAYKILVSVVRKWIEDRALDVSFPEFSFFYEAIFELLAESMRRYSRYDAAQIREARSRHVAALAHQMRTPIATMSMGAQILGTEGPIDGDVVSSMQRAVRRLKILAGGLLRLERFRPNETPVHPEPIRLADLLEEIVFHHRSGADERNLALVVEVDPQEEISADPELCTDAIDNLIQNAVKYCESGVVTISARTGADMVLIEVIDEGPGIEPDRQKNLFSTVTPGKGGGAGIGLMIARHAVSAQMGEIGVDSEPGKGCRFWIRLPREVPARS